MKRYSLISLFLVLLIALVGLKETQSKDLELIVCDVGQGDAILIQLGMVQVLIDGGQNQEVLRCLSQYMPWFDRQIELVVATHPDADHISGLFDVISTYQVKRLLWTGESKETADFKRFHELIQAKTSSGLEVVNPQRSQVFQIGEETFLRPLYVFAENILQDADANKYAKSLSVNDGSIAILLTHKQAKALLMADIEVIGEQAMLNLGLLADVNLLKVGHHGSKSSTGLSLLSATRPEISVISVGKNNQYGHPSPEVISRLVDFGSIVLRTDLVGDIKFISDGQTFLFESQSKLFN